jgi:hypothetical protein
MMELFHEDGHLTDEALDALAKEDNLPDLNRLEISEHLGYCNDCLERYAAMMTEETLLSPARSCGPEVWKRAHLRAANTLLNRHAAAVAAVIVTIGALWGSLGLPMAQQPRARTVHRTAIVSQEQANWSKQHAKRWNEANKKTFSQLDKVWNFVTANTPTVRKGGNK